MKTYKFIILMIVAGAIAFAVIWAINEWIFSAGQSLGSVAQTGEYKSTTTKATYSSGYVANLTSPSTGSSTSGTLGSVILGGTNLGTITIYDATTSDATKRASSITTSSMPILATIPNAATSGVYTYDVIFMKGLLLVYDAAVATTTITYR